MAPSKKQSMREKNRKSSLFYIKMPKINANNNLIFGNKLSIIVVTHFAYQSFLPVCTLCLWLLEGYWLVNIMQRLSFESEFVFAFVFFNFKCFSDLMIHTITYTSRFLCRCVFRWYRRTNGNRKTIAQLKTNDTGQIGIISIKKPLN